MEENNQKQQTELEKVILEVQVMKPQFIKVLTKIHGKSEDEAESIYNAEIMFFKKALKGEPKLQKCKIISLQNAFLEIAITGLSIQSGSKSEAYLESRGTNIGTRDNAVWENNAALRVTAYGELNMRIRSGQIVRMNNPQVIEYFNTITQKE